MASILKVDTIQDQTGNNIISENANVITIGASGDTITVPAGVTVSGFTSAGIDDNATSTAITIDSFERVGILQTSPTSNLHVASGGNTKVRFEGNLNTNTSSFLLSHTASGDAGLHFNSNQLNMFSYGDIAFYPSTSNISGSYPNGEVMRIRNTGRVGIGTSTPSQTLHVLNGTSSGGLIEYDGQSNAEFGLRIQSNISGGNFESDFASGTTALLDLFANSSTTSGGDLLVARTQSATPVLLVKGNGKVGIGETAPLGKLHIKTGDSGQGTAQGEADELVIEGSTNAGINILSGASNLGMISFGDSADANVGFIHYNHSNNAMTFRTNASDSMLIDSSGNVGIGTSSPGSYKLSIVDSSNCLLKFRGGSSSGTYQQFEVNDGATTIGYLGDGQNLISGGSQNDICLRGTNNIKFAIANFQKTTISSSGLTVHGALSKSSGSFKIDHPLPSKTNTHHLVHSFTESPQADLIYRSKVDLVNGTATVNIDTVAGMTEGTFVLLNTNIQCFTSNETGWIAVKGSVSGNILTITAQDNTCTDTISWMVIGERQDQHMYDTDWTDDNGKVIVEPLKETEE
jgi:hypothetical protein